MQTSSIAYKGRNKNDSIFNRNCQSWIWTADFLGQKWPHCQLGHSIGLLNLGFLFWCCEWHTTVFHIGRYAKYTLLCCTMEFFSRRRWKLVMAQWSNKFGYGPSWIALLFEIFQNSSLPFGPIRALSPSTRELLHGYTLHRKLHLVWRNNKERRLWHEIIMVYPALSPENVISNKYKKTFSDYLGWGDKLSYVRSH